MASSWAVAFGLVLPALLAYALPASAEPSETEKQTARELMAEARDLRAQQDNGGALTRFQAADAIMGVPTTGFEVARTQADLGLFAEARSTLRRVLAITERPDDPEPFKAARAKARQLDAELAQRLEAQRKPSATGAESSRPSEALPPESTSNTDSGPPPAAPAEQSSAPSKPIPPLAYVGGGIAVAGLLVGGFSGIVAVSKKHAAEDGCVAKRCPPSTWSDLDAAHSFATVSSIGFIAAGVGIGIGAGALLFGQHSSGVAASLVLTPTANGLSMHGRF